MQASNEGLDLSGGRDTVLATLNGALVNLLISLAMLAVMLGGIAWAIRTGRLRWPFRKGPSG